MKLSKLLEGNVIKFPMKKTKLEKNDLTIPPGYESFEQDGKKVVGIKSDGKKVVISTCSDEKLAKMLVQTYNTGGYSSSKINKISLSDAFGGDGYSVAKDAGATLLEKPSYFSSIDKDPIDEVTFRKIRSKYKNAFGSDIKEYSAKDVFGTSGLVRDEDVYPQSDAKKQGADELLIVKFPDGAKYLVGQRGASSYNRFWRALK